MWHMISNHCNSNNVIRLNKEAVSLQLVELTKKSQWTCHAPYWVLGHRYTELGHGGCAIYITTTETVDTHCFPRDPRSSRWHSGTNHGPVQLSYTSYAKKGQAYSLRPQLHPWPCEPVLTRKWPEPIQIFETRPWNHILYLCCSWSLREWRNLQELPISKESYPLQTLFLGLDLSNTFDPCSTNFFSTVNVHLTKSICAQSLIFPFSSLKPASSVDTHRTGCLCSHAYLLTDRRKSVLLASIISSLLYCSFLSFSESALSFSESAGCAHCLAVHLLSLPLALPPPSYCISLLSSIPSFSKTPTGLPGGFTQIQPCLPSAQWFSGPIRQCPCLNSTVSITLQDLASAYYVSLFSDQSLCIWCLDL